MSRVLRSPLKFKMEHPDYAAAAREFVRSRPDVRSLKFVAATVGSYATDHGGEIAHITVELDSPERVLWIDVRQDGDRWEIAAVIRPAARAVEAAGRNSPPSVR
jgi:hypothetical protein